MCGSCCAGWTRSSSWRPGARHSSSPWVQRCLSWPGFAPAAFPSCSRIRPSALPPIRPSVVSAPPERLGGQRMIIRSRAALSIATLTTNIAANIVAPATGFSNLAPHKITFKQGATITAVIGILMMPWRLYNDAAAYIFTWLIGYGALLGPVAGIMIADYFVVRRGELIVNDLYRRHGVYEYSRGFNWVAIGALALGVLPSLPGFVAARRRVPETRRS